MLPKDRILINALYALPLGAIAGGNDTDLLALLAFKKQATVGSVHALTSWNSTLHYCSWEGITCSKDGYQRVTNLSLTAQGLVGTLSPSLGNLSFLREINLGDNAFHGNIPPDLSNLVHLRTLNLTSNSLAEYGLGSEVSTLGDVYSYGILLLEMFTGKRPTAATFNEGLGLHDLVKMSYPDRVMEIVDPQLLLADKATEEYFNNDNIHSKIQECLISVIRIGLSCSSASPRERMEIQDVIVEMIHIRERLVKKEGILGK